MVSTLDAGATEHVKARPPPPVPPGRRLLGRDGPSCSSLLGHRESRGLSLDKLLAQSGNSRTQSQLLASCDRTPVPGQAQGVGLGGQGRTAHVDPYSRHGTHLGPSSQSKPGTTPRTRDKHTSPCGRVTSLSGRPRALSGVGGSDQGSRGGGPSEDVSPDCMTQSRHPAHSRSDTR